ncbi:hypothetical protein JTE90_004523 [Oedothorax gibbosus]|uniref:Uncharacterized protein n=1 Tax=Oedothorax gibbosus TaxID=931172 RepID=A0AAV6VCB4_9ARAC|nr:hypothetical protein JTE90_004523 [Oedothorax gibbosus]
MLRYLTHKLKTQSLNEADSYNPSKNDDDHDSGTESDDEGADAEELEKYMDESSLREFSSSSSSAPSSSDRACSSTLTEDTLTSDHSPPALLLMDPSSEHLLLTDHHSSEEELEVINKHHTSSHKVPEKRKWSRLSGGGCSSDDEVRDLMCCHSCSHSCGHSCSHIGHSCSHIGHSCSHSCSSRPVEFRSSPPANVPKPSPPPSKLFHSEDIPPHELCCAVLMSPRKRHRRIAGASSTPSEARPCLDFEKMQQNRRKRNQQAYITRGKSYILCQNV